MNELQVFNYGSAEVRTVMVDGEPWWVAKDVCDILEHTNPSVAIDMLDADERCKKSLGRQGDAWVVSEPGLYQLIMRSNKPQAKPFQRWVTHEVLPQIRKTGAYGHMVPKTFREALLLAAEQQLVIEQQKAQLEIAAPKTHVYDCFIAAENTQTVSQVAKLFGTGQKRMFKKLRELGILMPNNTPYQEYIDRGYFVVKERPIVMGDRVHNHMQTFVTAKGIDWLERLYRRFLEAA